MNSSTANRSEGLQVRTALKCGAGYLNHNEALRVRSTVKAGAGYLNHNEALRVRSTVKAGAGYVNHNENIRRDTNRGTILMRLQPKTTTGRKDRLELMVVRAGLRAGARNRRARWA